jgi:hypothetical protein
MGGITESVSSREILLLALETVLLFSECALSGIFYFSSFSYFFGVIYGFELGVIGFDNDYSMFILIL